MKHLTSPESPAVVELMNKIPSDVLSSLQQKLNNVETALLTKDPMMPNHLRESHRLLISYPESVHLLDDQEIQNLIKAAEAFTLTTIVKEPAKKGPAKKKVSLDDL